MDIKFLKDLENEFLTYQSDRGTDYSLFNSDWAINLKYFIDLLYHRLFNFYIQL